MEPQINTEIYRYSIEFKAIALNEYLLGRTADLQKIDGELSSLDTLKFTFEIFKV
ncbi:MAG: hypothetical protein KME38_21095 [Spirirestis rafaelensis WJT71-NPBG6]|jgi:hypothetical protein|nr:hypothetical protein [Spirirestis rafaelensis WJT71-NPBG6]